jgi:hypothetical protein
MLVLLPSQLVHAQFWAKCETASEGELDRNILEHHQQMLRMSDKFKTGWYLQGSLPPSFEDYRLIDLKSALKAHSTPKESSAVLFYAYSGHSKRLCIWLIGSDEKVEGAIRDMPPSQFDSIRPRLLAALGAVPPGPIRDKQEIKRISEDLVPPRIVHAIEKWKLGRLLIVPIFDLGEVPYAALVAPDGRMLMDVVKITILPGFFVFKDRPRTPSGAPEESIVAAYEGGSGSFPGSEAKLQYALVGAEKVKQLLGVKAPVFSRRNEALGMLQSGTHPRFIFVAAHGVSNTQDPLEGGFVGMADGPWTGKEVAKLKVHGGLESNPVVILSACESGTGKMFDVGAMGLSRAWYHAGASSVVASLWRVDERKTMELMTIFIEKAKSMLPDEALWAAMKALRDKENPDPMYWASFSIFGIPPAW